MLLNQIAKTNAPVHSFGQMSKCQSYTGMVKRGDSWRIIVSSLLYDESLDVRCQVSGIYYQQDSVSSIVEAIKTAYLSGDDVEPIGISFIDGVPTVTSGFKRYRAAMMANAESDGDVMVGVVDVGSCPKEILKRSIVSNNSDRPSKVDLGAIFHSLMSHGTSLNEIMCMTGYPASEIRACIESLGFPEEIKNLLISKRMSAAQWDSMVKEYGDSDAADIAVDTAKHHGKVTERTVSANKNIVKPTRSAIKNQLFDTFRHIAPSLQSAIFDNSGSVQLTLDPNDYQMLMSLKEMLD